MSRRPTRSAKKGSGASTAEGVDVFLRCLKCGYDTGKGGKRVTGKEHTTRQDDDLKRVTSRQLSSHLSQTHFCRLHCAHANLAFQLDNSGGYDCNLTSSIIARKQNGNYVYLDSPQGSTPNHRRCYPPGPLGVRCPIHPAHRPDVDNLHSSINNQTVYSAVLPMQKHLLQGITKTNVNESSHDSGKKKASASTQESEVRKRQKVQNAEEEGATRTGITLASDVEDQAPLEIDLADAEDQAPGEIDFTLTDDNSVISPDRSSATPPLSKSSFSKAIEMDTTKEPNKLSPTSQHLAEISLMSLMRDHKMSLQCFESIWEWAQKSDRRPGFRFRDTGPARKRAVILKEIRVYTDKEDEGFLPHVVDGWLPYDKPIQIWTRDFTVALKSLLENTDLTKEENLSFPDQDVPYSWKNFVQKDCEITELHHGTWWVESWAKAFPLMEKSTHGDNTEVKEILVPVIFCMDGVAIDRGGRLKLTPLNMSLGMLNTETRKRPEAWETVYFHPDSTVVQIAQSSQKPSSLENAKNLHNALKVALQSFFEVCQNPNGIVWNGLPCGGKIWKVRMKFATAYVIGDMELHDELCGRHKSCTTKVQKMCRHCNISSDDLVDPAKQPATRLWKPEDFAHGDADYFKSVSHHDIDNAFHRLNFGSNQHNMHLATPSELLHVLQLGAEKRAVEAFVKMVGPTQNTAGKGTKKKKSKQKNEGTKNGGKALENLGLLAQHCGAVLTRQSDRNFPRTKHTSVHILKTSMKEGTQYAGILLCIMVTLVSKLGLSNLKSCVPECTDFVRIGFIETLEMLLGLEEFLKYGGIKQSEIPKLETLMDELVHKITQNCRRNDLEEDLHGTRLPKTHQLFHIPLHMQMFGPPDGLDSSPSESNHKTDTKAPSKNTQCRSGSIIKQTCVRKSELRTLDYAERACKLRKKSDPSQPTADPCHGPKFWIRNGDKGPQMRWCDPRKRNFPIHCKEAIDFCVKHVLPCVETADGKVFGFAQHERIGELDKMKCICRAHPSFRGDSNQRCNSWYDWAYFDVCPESDSCQTHPKPCPCHILCFLDIDDGMVKTPPAELNSVEIVAGQYAIVRKFSAPPEPIKIIGKKGMTTRTFSTKIVKKGTLCDKSCIMPCESTFGDVAVVPDYDHRSDNQQYEGGRSCFVIENSMEWRELFLDKIRNAKEKDHPRQN